MECLTRPCQNCDKPMNGGLYRARHVCPHCLFEHEDIKSRRKRRSATVANTAVANIGLSSAEPRSEMSEPEAPAQAAPRVPEPVVQAQPVEAARPEAPAHTPAQETYPAAHRSAPAAAKAQPAKDGAMGSAKPVSGGRAQPSDEVTLIPKAPPAKSREPNIILTSRSLEEYAELDIIDSLKSECVLSVRLSPDMFIEGKFVGNKHDKIKAALDQGKKQVLAQLRQQALKQGANIVTNIEFKNSLKLLDREQARITVSAAGTAAKAEVTEIAMGA